MGRRAGKSQKRESTKDEALCTAGDSSKGHWCSAHSCLVVFVREEPVRYKHHDNKLPSYPSIEG